MIRSHRAPSRQLPRPSKRSVVSVAIAALVFATGAPLFMSGATADTVLTFDQVRQACANRLAQGTAGLSSGSVNLLKNCASVKPAPAPTTSPSGTPSSTPPPSPSPTVTASPTPTSPSPSPTSSSPSPTPTGTVTGCLAVPSACGFPDSTNTGATGTNLAVVTGDVTLSTAGQVFADKQVNGCILVTAANVVIKDVKVSCADNYVIDVTSGSATASATIQDVTVDCGTNAHGTAIGEHNLTVQRVNVSGCENGFDIDSNTVITDTYCHDLTDEVQFPTAHTDCVQGIMTNDVTIEHNTLLAGHFSTSAVGGGVAGVRWVVDDNLLDAGAAAVYCDRSGAGAGSAVTNNRFGSNGWNYPAYADTCAQPNVAWSGNVRDSTGASLPAE